MINQKVESAGSDIKVCYLHASNLEKWTHKLFRHMTEVSRWLDPNLFRNHSGLWPMASVIFVLSTTVLRPFDIDFLPPDQYALTVDLSCLLASGSFFQKARKSNLRILSFYRKCSLDHFFVFVTVNDILNRRGSIVRAIFLLLGRLGFSGRIC